MLLIIGRRAGVFVRNTLRPSVLGLTECHSILAPDQARVKTVKNPDPDSFRPENQRSRTQNPQQMRPQPLWIGVREAGPPIRVQEARRRYPRALYMGNGLQRDG